MDVVISNKDTQIITFPYDGNWGYMPPDNQGFGVIHRDGTETRYTVPKEHWGTLRAFTLEGLELPLTVITLKKLEQLPKKAAVDSIIWVRDDHEYVNMLPLWGVTPGIAAKTVKKHLTEYLEKHTNIIAPAEMMKVMITTEDMGRVTLWNRADPIEEAASISVEWNTGFSILTNGQEHHYAIPAYLRGIVHDFIHEQATLAHMLLILEYLDRADEDTLVTEVTLGYLRKGWDADCLAQWLIDVEPPAVTVGQLRHLIDSYVGMLTVQVQEPEW